ILTEITDFSRKNKNFSFVELVDFLRKKDIPKNVPSIINFLLKRSLFDESFNIFETSVSKNLGPVDKRFNPKPRGGDIEEDGGIEEPLIGARGS
ncbi:hypothetical protein, partial [Gluconobacter kondonii]|uniref:hypothetical protein n=1 Tax=Gluconobacter kondonii TaxID=941463 RepID=UPI00223047C3